MAKRKKETFVPSRGDIIWISFSPQRGHEQAGHRPAIVLSKRSYNERSGLVVICPITSKSKDYPFEVPIVTACIQGFVLADQIKSTDWRACKPKFVDAAPEETLAEISRMGVDLIRGA